MRRLAGRALHWGCALVGASLVVTTPAAAEASAPVKPAMCMRTVTADVVALDQAFFWNRLGAVQPQGMIFALKDDVVSIDGTTLSAGNVKLRPGKRPRPLTLRMNEGDCLEISFTNLLSPTPVDGQQPATRSASIHVNGLQLVNSITDAGQWVGENPQPGYVGPDGMATYTLFADAEGTHLMYSAGALAGGEGDNSSISAGLFGAVNVEPAGAEWYRSQVTREEMDLATVGTSPDGQPIIDYDAVYPAGHPRAGLPIMSILHGNEIVHSDLNAIITGGDRGPLAFLPMSEVVVNRNRTEPFREFTVIFHDEAGAVQAFPEFFNDPELEYTLHGVRDAFAINYGTGGIGAEILANRLGLGPMWNCNECKYEEFFLSSWVVGDPAMVVDFPANTPADDGTLGTGPKATKVFYPDDPSNVFHSYLNDHVKIRNLHAGPKEHHIFHLHAHQWLNSPNDDNSSYLDSQSIGPGSEYTYEITYDGGGNRNKTPGDAIFHCHFYPHFAMGMWALWRNHDVFEVGTQLDADGRPTAALGNRALPDGEIDGGTPIPGVVPIPGKAMAPMPTETFAGYPFYLPGVGGHRPPTAPMDIIDDGGLPRHVVVDNQTTLDGDHPVSGLQAQVTAGSAGTATGHATPLDMSKHNVLMNALQLPENGTYREQQAMAFHSTPTHSTYVQPTNASINPLTGVPNLVEGNFTTNGAPAAPGAPFADPCVADDLVTPVLADNVKTYRAAHIQIDATYNKAGWHYPQHRMRALWGDVSDIMSGDKAPEPLFFRANTGDCVQYIDTNLVPKEYTMDDFQVQTPTDIIGSHIHLVKFDVMASDGSANGYNYEDGTMAAGEVVERINAINATDPTLPGVGGGLIANDGTTPVDITAPTRVPLVAEVHPFFGPGPNNEWVGARTTIQRWYVDDVLNTQGEDRTLRTVFTHDHYGPSTHQQAGLYAALVAEPAGSEWRDPETGEMMGGRIIDGVGTDGGPTSWRADILTEDPADSYREFNFFTTDFHLAYKAGGGVDAQGNPIPDPANAINPPGKEEIPLPFITRRPQVCPNGMAPPCPEAISVDDPGTMLVNYRNEPLALRIRDPQTNTQAAGIAGDLSHAFRSDLGTETLADGTIVPIERADDRLNTQPDFYPPLTAGVEPGDPFTPLLRVYEDDKIQVRVMNGAQEEGHNFTVHGAKWLFEPNMANSGYRNGQMNGISEHFELLIPDVAPVKGSLDFEDYLYNGGTSTDDMWSGMWGILRAYAGLRDDLLPLPSNPDGKSPPVAKGKNGGNFAGVCPALPDAPRGNRARPGDALPWEPQNRKFHVVAVLARDVVPEGTLVYNEAPGTGPGQTLHDPTAMMFVRATDLDGSTGMLKEGVPVEPLVLRANAGDCVFVTLENRLPAEMPDLDGWNTLPLLVDDFNNNQIRPSSHVGLHPQLVAYDMNDSDGANVGFNPVQTAAPGEIVKYKWYAGDVQIADDGTRTAVPIEFGVTSLQSSDRIKHASKGGFGTLIIEPQYSTWVTDYETGQGQGSRAAATVTLNDENGTALDSFRELALMIQDDVNLRTGAGDGVAVENLAESEDPEDSGQKAINYRSEPFWNRLGTQPDATLGSTNARTDMDAILSNTITGRDPVTPILEVEAGTPVRIRLTQGGGHARNHAFTLSGHSWQESPFQDGSTRIGDNPTSNTFGVQAGIGVGSHFNFVLDNGAGGAFAVPGDYLYRDFASFQFDGGLWGILRVTPAAGAQQQP